MRRRFRYILPAAVALLALWAGPAVAQAIASQSAQVGLGLRAAAFRSSLDFIPLYQERYDLVIQKEQSENHALSQLIDQLESGAFRQALRSLPGYDAEHTGECTSIH